MVLQEDKAMGHYHLLSTYCKLTGKQVATWGKEREALAVLIFLVVPFKPLSADRTAAVTKEDMTRFGADTIVYSAHATPSAGVGMYANMQLPAKVFCEMGKWKNLEAF